MKEYKVRRHYETKRHSNTSYTGAERRQKFKQMVANLQTQQFFFRANKTQESATTASYEVAKLIAHHGKPFLDSNFIKQCHIKVTELKCRISAVWAYPEIKKRIEDLSANLKLQLRDKASAFNFYSIACDESIDATDTAQLLIVLRGVDDN